MKSFCPYFIGVALLCSCINNDLPLPVVQGAIESIDVEGAVEVNIDAANRIVDIVLDESVDIRAVKVSGVSYKNPHTVSKPDLTGVHDLSNPLDVTLSTWQDYEWTIRARQIIEREFSVKGQIGQAVIDDVNHRIIAYVSGSADLEDILVTGLKLGPAGVTSYVPDPSEIKDFTEGVCIEVGYRGISESWMIYLEQSDFKIRLDSVDPWTRCAWAMVSAPEGSEVVLDYRERGDSLWINVPADDGDGGTYSVLMDNLSPLSHYECRARCSEDVTDIVEFTTEDAVQLPNSGFNTFSNAESAVYYSWYDPDASDKSLATKWWDSGNTGSTTLGSSYCIALPDTTDHVEGNASALLVSRFAIVKLAAGNTFSGEFASLVGTSGGIINFGRPWESRPRGMRLWIKYTGGEIDVVDASPQGIALSKGDPDQCQIWIALGNWDYRKFGGTPDCPVQVNTTDIRTFFNPESPAVIAYGSYSRSEPTDGWIQVEIPLEYRYNNRKPTHIIVSLSSNKWGDYFTGSSRSRLAVDNIELLY
ncbi:MAG: PCMD domain-containing protein [Bacteroidales bacterium]|nr:PCMD domain-containing protein [Bacteroidales bacterium]